MKPFYSPVGLPVLVGSGLVKQEPVYERKFSP